MRFVKQQFDGQMFPLWVWAETLLPAMPQACRSISNVACSVGLDLASACVRLQE